MELKIFADTPREELSMIEVAKAILMERDAEDVIELNDLLKEIQDYLGRTDAEMRDALPQFYTDLNIDGSFISLGDNRWGLRSWYPIDSIDEEVSHTDDEAPRRTHKAKKVNAFMDNDEDAIDYSNDDPEDTDLSTEDDNDELFDEDDNSEISEYRHDLSSMGDADDEVPESVEDDLTIIEHDEDHDENY